MVLLPDLNYKISESIQIVLFEIEVKRIWHDLNGKAPILPRFFQIRNFHCL